MSFVGKTFLRSMVRQFGKNLIPSLRELATSARRGGKEAGSHNQVIELLSNAAVGTIVVGPTNRMITFFRIIQKNSNLSFVSTSKDLLTVIALRE